MEEREENKVGEQQHPPRSRASLMLSDFVRKQWA